MPLYLVNPAVEMTLELWVSQRLEEALTIQYERIKDRRVRDTFVKRLEGQIETLLKDCIDWDLKEPTEAQLNYATLVATQLGIPLPSEARRYRFHAAMFLETYVPKVRQAASSDATVPGGFETGAAAAQRLVEERLCKQADDPDTSSEPPEDPSDPTPDNVP